MRQWEQRAADSEAVAGDDIKFSGAMDLPLDLIVPDRIGLRTEVDKDGDQYKQLKDDIAARGIINSISVRRATINGETRFIIIDGLQRFTIATELGLLQVPVVYFPNVRDQATVMTMQISTNLQRVQTKPAQFGRQLLSILALHNGTLTQGELAAKTGLTQTQVSQFMRIANRLKDHIKRAVDDGQVTAINAYLLAKLPEEIQDDFFDKAKNMVASDFTMIVNQELDAIKKRSGGKREVGFQPHAKLRTKNDVVARINELITQLNPHFTEDQVRENEANPSLDHLLGYYYGLTWCAGLDSKSIEAARELYEQNEQERRRKQMEKQQASGKTLKDLLFSGKAPAEMLSDESDSDE